MFAMIMPEASNKPKGANKMNFSKNLRRLRLSQKLTQEQVAAALGVSAQSVSRWECGATLPDVTMLPAIARLYCVTIDDLYRQDSPAYANYAQRLGCVFEASRKPEDFLQAYAGVVTAVAEGTISRQRVEDSLRRIYRIKYAEEAVGVAE